MKYYVIKNRRLKNFLFSLGLNYKKKVDKYDDTKNIYLFEDNKKLRECITFYTEFKKENKE